LPLGYALLIEEYFDQMYFFKILLVGLDAAAFWLVIIFTRIQMFHVYSVDVMLWLKDLGMLLLLLGLWGVVLSSAFRNKTTKLLAGMVGLFLIVHSWHSSHHFLAGKAVSSTFIITSSFFFGFRFNINLAF
jgi:hypothetical protein